MSKILRRCLSLVLVIMLLASFSLGGTLNASADNKTGDGLAAYAMRAYNEGWAYVWGGASPGAVDCSGLIYSYVEGGESALGVLLDKSGELLVILLDLSCVYGLQEPVSVVHLLT